MGRILKFLKRLSKKRFYDKNGKRIKIGDKLKVPIYANIMFKDKIVREINGKLGLLFASQDKFIPFCSLLKEFFENCEIIKNINKGKKWKKEKDYSKTDETKFTS